MLFEYFRDFFLHNSNYTELYNKTSLGIDLELWEGPEIEDDDDDGWGSRPLFDNVKNEVQGGRIQRKINFLTHHFLRQNDPQKA